MVVNTKVWCHCLYYQCLGDSCFTLPFLCTIISKLHLSIMKIVMTSWTPLVTVLAHTFSLHFTLFISPFRFTKIITFLPSLYLKIQLHVFTILVKGITHSYHPGAITETSFPHSGSFSVLEVCLFPIILDHHLFFYSSLLVAFLFLLYLSETHTKLWALHHLQSKFKVPQSI